MSRSLTIRFRSEIAALALGALVVSGVATGSASAYLAKSSAGTGVGHVGSLPAPAIATATAGTGTVTLTWGAVSAPGGGSVSYYVRRDGGAPAGSCPTSSSPSPVTTCTDSGLAPGNHVYTVTAVWRSWTARGAEKTVNVATGVADHLVLSASDTTPTAGVADALTIVAKDSAGNTVTTYSGSKSLTFGGAQSAGANHPTVTNSTGTAVAFGTAETITFTNGQATVSGTKNNGQMTLYKAETANVTVSDGTLSNGAGTSLVVGVGSTSAFALSAPGAQTAGTPFNETITAVDAYGNTTTSYTGAKSMTFTGPEKTSPNGKTATFPSSVTFNSGVGTAAITLVTAQTTTLTAKQSFSTSGTSASFTVAPAAAAALSVVSPGTQTAGTQFTVAISAIDAYGNTQPEYAGTKALTFSEPDASPSGKEPAYPETVSFSNGKGSAAITLYDAELTPLKATDGTLTGTSSNFTVNGATTAVAYSLSTPTPTAGTAFTETITAKDTYGNAATYSGTKTIAFSGPGSSPKGEAPKYPSSVSFTSGASTNASITLYNAAATTLTAKENTAGISGTSASFSVSAAAPTVFVWGPIASPQTAGTQFSATLTADDAYGNLATYEGTKAMTFTGPIPSPGGKAPVFPASVSFTAGTGTANITLYDAQTSQTIAATQGSVKGTSAAFDVNPLAASALSLAAPTGPAAGTAFGETVTAVDTYGNAAAGYEGAKLLTFSNPAPSPSGKAPSYPASVTFTAGVGTAQVTLYDAQTTTIGATDGTLSGTSSSFIVSPASAASFALSTPAPTAGTSFNETLTAKDPYGNTATSYTGSKTVNFTGPANSPGGKAPSYPAGQLSFTAGATTAAITLYNAASTTLTATQSTITGSASFTVAAASPSAFVIASPGTQTAGTAFTLTLTANDAYGNAATYEGTKTITFKGPEASPSETAPLYPASVSFTAGKGTANVTLYDAATAVSVEASQTSGPKGTSPSFAVNTAAAAKTAWTGVSASTGAEEGNCLFTCTWSGFVKNREWSSRVSVTDTYGNVASNVGSGHNVTLTMTESASTGKLSTKSLTVPATGTATSSSSVTYTSPNSNTWSSDSFTALAAGFTTASATIKK
jgi:hypothetical protein